MIWTIILRPAGAQAAGDRQPVPMNSSDGRSCGEISKEGHWNCEAGSSESSERLKRTGEAEDCGWHMTSTIDLSPDVSVSQVAAIIHVEGIDAVPVVDRTGKVLGVVTAADLIRLLAGADALPS